ncbi:hypothetical protein FHR83_007760 [Actinoplanes campanulatus]|uniref:Uncharacterized protein n=1 Tax=Actinoplanes campanulatus TaxID=113559 RepID=A0A7W5APX1_9ACTN|nr:hypothetical protein [Actinoplanes campanulatus]MBB3100042.1 hypothetical protein [Actinoplanes campanulatus]GGN29291.1 hypothetical protein GCM10010109_48150 [Actinoplanes campanulatus]GID38909.1 hypothetical protein Aca09nite_54150 [Actinoplanes campanulatus]
MSDEPSSELPERASEQPTSRPVQAGRAKSVVVAFLLVLGAAMAVGVIQARAGSEPGTADPAPAPTRDLPGSQTLHVSDLYCQDDAATCQRLLDDPALADKLAAQGPAGDTRQFVPQVEAALPENPDKRTACGFDDETCVAKPPPAEEIRQALTAAGIPHFEMRTTGPEQTAPNGTVFVGIRHGPGCVIVRMIDYTPDIYDQAAGPDGTCLPA